MPRISKPTLSKSERRRVEELVAHFDANRHQFKRIVGELNAAFTTSPTLKPLVHSLQWRIKDSGHLKEKLIRKWLDAKKNGLEFEIEPENLFQEINDLVGFRLLHLYMRQMEQLNGALIQSLSEGYKLIEGPSAQTWDDESRKYFEGLGIETKANERMYTSVHYVFETRSVTKFTCEIQVRTLAEELWGEVDHSFNYPHPTDTVACREQIKVLARLASACTRLVDSIYTSRDVALALSTNRSLGKKTRRKRS